MDLLKIVGILLIAVGIIGLVYGGITYTKSTHDAKVGPLEFSLKNKQTVNIPVWAGVGAIVVGGVLLFGRRRIAAPSVAASLAATTGRTRSARQQPPHRAAFGPGPPRRCAERRARRAAPPARARIEGRPA